MKYLAPGIISIFLSISAQPKPIGFLKNNTLIQPQEVKKILNCKPLTISESGPLPPVSEMPRKTAKDLTVLFGSYRFSRTDVGQPDGQLKVYFKNKLICDVETSILSGIKIVPVSNLILLKWASGSSNTWEIFQTKDTCKSIGLISDKNRSEFEMLISQLKPCLN